ncbi:MAG: hypothetical protein RBJ76_13785 [Stenomitos frigidus ULC029]
MFSAYSFTVTAPAAQNSVALTGMTNAWAWLPSGLQFQLGGVMITVGVVRDASGILVRGAPTTIPVAPLSASLLTNAVGTVPLDDNSRIRKHLRLRLNDRVVVQSQMDLVTRYDPLVIPDIQRLLAESDFLDSVSSGQGSNGNATLIKADVLEWLPGGQLMTVGTRKSEIRLQLARYLDLEAWLSSGQARYSRS